MAGPDRGRVRTRDRIRAGTRTRRGRHRHRARPCPSAGFADRCCDRTAPARGPESPVPSPASRLGPFVPARGWHSRGVPRPTAGGCARTLPWTGGEEAPMRVVVLADTHVRASTAAGPMLPEPVYRDLRRADVILHAGDVVDERLLVELGTFAPVFAVLGNNDDTLVDALPPTLELELSGVPVAMVHDSGPRDGRAARMHRRF